MSSFRQYLPNCFSSLLTSPTALSPGDVKLHEAARARAVHVGATGMPPQAALARRAEVLRQHMSIRGSQTRLRGLLPCTARRGYGGGHYGRKLGCTVVARANELLEIDPSDALYLFREEMTRLFFVMREVEPEGLDEETMDHFLQAVDHVSTVLHRIERLRQARARRSEKLMT